MSEQYNFEKLAAINVGQHVEKKGQFTYLSWAWAVDFLSKHCPDVTWEVVRFDGLPFLKTECGYFVEVAVTVSSKRLSQIHPVLNNQNKPIVLPNAFEINTSIQRCLVKAIALHGLGLYIYAGEDLPSTDEPGPREQMSPGAIDEAKVQAKLKEAVSLVDADGMTDGGMEESNKRAKVILAALSNDERMIFKDLLTEKRGGDGDKQTYYGMFKKHLEWKPPVSDVIEGGAI